MSLTTPLKIRKLRSKLYELAKQESPGVLAGHAALLGGRDLRPSGGVPTAPSAAVAACGSENVNPVGKPDARNPHVRFDERGRETES